MHANKNVLDWKICKERCTDLDKLDKQLMNAT